jgi:SpoVK/Ycf46/Vps4 family AAA+-type ATPase
MRTLSHRSASIPTLYVKSAPATYYIRSIFQFARRMSPCLLVLEDIETIVTPRTRSYFFNEVDGLENNDGILMVASTNYLERLDPGLTKRPSRFDRKYLFPLPNEQERILYAEYWHEKLKSNSNVEFPKKLCRPIASITDDFSFAYMQEAFVATLLELARRRTDNLVDIAEELRLSDGEKDGLDQYVFWRVMKKQVKILRDDMNTRESEHHYVPPSMQASQMMEPLQSSTPTLPGTYRDENAMSLSTSRSAFGDLRRDIESHARAQGFLSQFDKYSFINPAALEFRPFDGRLTWAKRS